MLIEPLAQCFAFGLELHIAVTHAFCSVDTDSAVDFVSDKCLFAICCQHVTLYKETEAELQPLLNEGVWTTLKVLK
jgi:hypothetical protein